MVKFCADFETTTDENDCRVWAFALSEIGNFENIIIGNSIEDFFNFIKSYGKNLKIYFHNLKFDGSFILSYLENNNYKWVLSKKERETKSYTTLVTDMGLFYAIEVYFKVNGKKTSKVTFYDSLKILNFSVEQIARDFDLPISKLEIDYTKKREIGHILTFEEKEYIKNDVQIMSLALEKMFDKGLKKITIGSDAMNDYKDGLSHFDNYFPTLDKEVDDFIRKSYKGGFTYLNPKYKEKEVGIGIVFDVNSMYPAKMYNELLPFGEPVYFEGEYKKDKLYNLFIINLDCEFELKENKIPSIQIKKNLFYKDNEYVEKSKGLVNLTLTSVDFELFKENYHIKNVSYNGGFKFKSMKGLFNSYIDKWTSEKIKAKSENNRSMYLISKLMLNSLYGKFGVSTNPMIKSPYLDKETGIVKWNVLEAEPRKSCYTAMSSYITSYARAYIIRSSEKIREWSMKKYNEDFYIYSDTDSIHLRVKNKEKDISDLSRFIEIDDFKLGAWKPESEFDRGAFIRQKCYIEEYNGELNVTIAGFPKYLAPIMKFEDFKIGFTTAGLSLNDLKEKARKNGASEDILKRIHHKLRYKYVKGGVILKDTDFTIK